MKLWPLKGHLEKWFVSRICGLNSDFDDGELAWMILCRQSDRALSWRTQRTFRHARKPHRWQVVRRCLRRSTPTGSVRSFRASHSNGKSSTGWLATSVLCGYGKAVIERACGPQ
jgi:hypothetical protein